MKITLYIATHNITGKKYFGKTTKYFTKEDLQKYYHGSGVYWKNHLKKHGDDVTMEIYGIYSSDKNSKEYVKPIALKFSEDNNIVEDYDNWANQTPENGLDGCNHTKESIEKHLRNTDRKKAELKRQNTNIKKYGGNSPSASKSIANKRLNSLNEIKDSGLTGLEENGIKISKALKGKVAVLNIKNNIKFRNVNQSDYDNCWYLVGHTAKYITLYEIEDVLYTEKGLNEDKDIFLIDFFKMRTNKPYKNVKIPVEDVNNNFEYYSSKISSNS